MKKNNKDRTRKAYKTKDKNNIKKKKTNIILSILVLMIVILNLSGQTKINTLNKEILDLKSQVHKEEVKLEQAKARKYSTSSLDKIEELAKEELYMKYLDEENIVYIDID